MCIWLWLDDGKKQMHMLDVLYWTNRGTLNLAVFDKQDINTLALSQKLGCCSMLTLLPNTHLELMAGKDSGSFGGSPIMTPTFLHMKNVSKHFQEKATRWPLGLCYSWDLCYILSLLQWKWEQRRAPAIWEHHHERVNMSTNRLEVHTWIHTYINNVVNIFTWLH